MAIVTGGGRGIGRASSLALAAAGADIVVASRKVDDLNRVVQEVERLGRRALAVPTHLAKLTDIRELAERAAAEFGRLDILINNAGTSPAAHPAIEADERIWDVIMNVNLKGLFFVCQAVARRMRESGGGVIVNIASVSGFRPESNAGIYAISKAGVIMATKVMAKEWAPYKIRVNGIAPGYVQTPLMEASVAAIPGYEEDKVQRTPMARIGNAAEIAAAVVYLASDAASFVTGATLTADGGFLLT